MSKISYNRASVFGGMTAEGVDSVIQGRDKLRRVQTAALVAIGSPEDYTKLEGGDFGAAVGQGQAWFNTMSSALASLEAIPPAFLEAIDMGG